MPMTTRAELNEEVRGGVAESAGGPKLGGPADALRAEIVAALRKYCNGELVGMGDVADELERAGRAMTEQNFEAAEKVIRFLNRRGGFDAWWEDIDRDAKEDD